MIRFSEGRLSFLAHQILATFQGEGLAETVNERLALSEIKKALDSQREHEAKLDEIVQRKILTLSRRVIPGSREWDVLYQRYLEEEHRKQKS